MIQINFFEKKKINILPYIIGVTFFVFLLLIGAYFFMTRSFHERTVEDNQAWLTDNAGSVVLSRQISQLDRLANESDMVQETLQHNQYPMDDIIVDIVSTIPNEAIRVQSFSITNPNQITLRLEETDSAMAQSIVENLMAKDYVKDIQFLHAEMVNQENDQLNFEMIIDIDARLLLEEETE